MRHNSIEVETIIETCLVRVVDAKSGLVLLVLPVLVLPVPGLSVSRLVGLRLPDPGGLRRGLLPLGLRDRGDGSLNLELA
jgi:hypothetical protein